MKSFNIPLAVLLAALAFGAAPAGAQEPAPAADDEQWGMLNEYCVTCHNFEDWAGGIAFDTMRPDAIHQDAEIWEKALRRLRGRLMPPPGEPQPPQEEIDSFVGWMESTLDSSADAQVAGYVPVQRLNATEYALAVKALIGVDLDATSILPTEVEVDGFDNIASALGTSPAFLEQYLTVARQAADLAVGDRTPKEASVFYPSPGGAQATHEDGMPLGTRGGVVFPHVFLADGDYTINILDLDVGLYPRAVEYEHTLLLLIDGEEVFRGELGGEEDLELVDRTGPMGAVEIMSRFQNIPVHVTAGHHEVAVAFIERSRVQSDAFVINNQLSGTFGATNNSLPHVINGIEIKGPFNPTGVSENESRRLIFVCEPASAAEEPACAEQIVSDLARRAFRRPMAQADLDALTPFYERARAAGGDFDDGIEAVVTAVLASPDFLYRTIAESTGDTAPVFALDDFELASRLSFFLWSQGPDDELLAAAEEGTLHEPEVLEAEVRRMLEDPRAQTLVSNFAMKWLNLDDLDAVDPNGREFPGFSNDLRDDFATEVQLFMKSVLLDEDRSVMDLLSADYTFVNEELANHYGIPGVRGDQFRRVTLEDPNRFGLLGKSAMLLRTSYGDRTSPVLRGAWIMDKLLGTPPTPPPPNVETDLTVPEGQPVTTIRARLEQHRADASCNSCHGVIDPWGLALENFDVTGRWRDVDLAANAPIDPTTVLSSGAAVDGPVQLREQLSARPGLIVQNMTEKLMMYGIGRELEYHDMPQVREIVHRAAEENYTLASIVVGIVESDAFRKQAAPDFADASEASETRIEK